MGYMTGNIMGGDGLIVIVVALVVLVGGSQLPKIARNVGLAGKEFRKAQSEAEAEHAQQGQGGPGNDRLGLPPPVARPGPSPRRRPPAPVAAPAGWPPRPPLPPRPTRAPSP